MKGFPNWFQNLLMSFLCFILSMLYFDFRGLQRTVHIKEVEFAEVRSKTIQHDKDIQYIQSTQSSLADALNQMAITMARLAALEDRRN
jgi:hypothetical protein